MLLMVIIAKNYFMENKEDIQYNSIELGSVSDIISLGPDCWPRIFVERFNLYNFKKNRVRMPFDGCQTPYHRVCTLLEGNFKDVFSKIRISDKINSYGANYIRTEQCLYNHEKTSNIDEFKNQMNSRTHQFNESLKIATQSKSIVVFFTVHKKFPHRLIEILKKQYSKLKFKIFCLDDTMNSTEKLELNKFCKYVNLPKPSKDYVLWKDGRSSDGLSFERCVLREFLLFLSEINNIKYDSDRVFSSVK